jgi:exodeoxyribonuclease III
VTLRLLSYNIRFGGRGREARIAEVIRALAPDLVVLQEATDPRVIGRVAELAGMSQWAARPAHSTGFLSRVSVEGHEWHHPAGARHAFLEVTLEGGARVFGLHLSARFSKWSERRRAREVGLLLEGVRRHQDGLHILAGDFNTLAPGEVLETRRMPAWIQALIWLSGRDIRRETIGRVLEAGYTDAFRHLHPDERGHTFPTWDPHVRLDYIFLPAREAHRLKSCDVMRLPEAARASDHFPLRAEIEID